MDEYDQDTPVFLSRQGGYDYEFVPALDPKYECGICLLALRSPHQTVCGHRFCRDCIANCMSSRSVCPVDQQPLSGQDVFPDACIEREVLELLVRCPGHTHGCTRRVTLRNLQHHVKACNYQVVLCPNQCASTVLCGELEEHLLEHCHLRPTRCSLCSAVYTFDKEPMHRATCGDMEVSCTSCGALCRRSELASHLTAACPLTLLPCLYQEMGCTIKAHRQNMDQHMKDGTQQHLQLVCGTYKKLNTFVSDLSRTVGLLQSPSFSRQPSLRSQLSASSPIAEESRTLSPGAEAADHVPDGGSDHEDQYKDKEFLKMDSKKRANIAAEAQRHQLHLSSINSMSASGGGASNLKVSSNERILRDLSEKAVDLNQRLLEESIRVDKLSKHIEDLEINQRTRMNALNGRLCHGDFLWHVNYFTTRCSDLKNNLSMYSPSFYTSQYGYKCCVRLAVKQRQNQCYLSLFIRFVKGDYDDILEWPFSGRITLGVLDRSSDGKKTNITDTMVSKPELQAFQRPTGDVNDKSFGFTYFYPLQELFSDEQSYLAGDVLSVRAKVVSDYPDFGEKRPVTANGKIPDTFNNSNRKNNKNK